MKQQVVAMTISLALILTSCASNPPAGENAAIADTGFGALNGWSRCKVGQEAGYRADGNGAHCCQNAAWGRPKTGDVDFGVLGNLFLGVNLQAEGLFSAALKLKKGTTLQVSAKYRYEWVADHRARVHCQQHGSPAQGRCADNPRVVAAKYIVQGKFDADEVLSAEAQAEVTKELTKFVGGDIRATANSLTTSFESGNIELCKNENHSECARVSDISAQDRTGSGWSFHGIRGEHPTSDEALRPITQQVTNPPNFSPPPTPDPKPVPPPK